MKIQDLRDDLAEMRYFRKSYLRKMKNEAGGGMLPMDGTLGGGGGGGGVDGDGGVVRPKPWSKWDGPMRPGNPLYATPQNPFFKGWTQENIDLYLEAVRLGRVPRPLSPIGPPIRPDRGPQPEPESPDWDNTPIDIRQVEGTPFGDLWRELFGSNPPS